MIRIQCSPALRSKETDVQFIKDFMKYIESNFRIEYSGHKNPIGLDQWWLQGDGNFFCGVTDDIDFYMYLCDDSHYPFSIGNVQIKLEPPKQLPVQNSVIIKFVPTSISKDDVLDEMKSRFSSIFMANEMKESTRTSARHIRVIFKQQNEYKKILYEGRIVIQGLVLNVDEYLPPPKILICMKCNLLGHIKKACQAPYSICSHPPAMNYWTSGQEAANTSLSKEYFDSAIRAFDNELNKIKKDFDEEKKRINSLYEKQIETVKKGWLILQ
ncbi:unnamed protein product [Didymodactylos carnosus]|uniref:CCHC-type domain-containing protein n=2 Tax=Didymodactylos carnosus TaxID=1234261 RepID=A0A8S2Y1E9_9BILA|nr:unnamed protein product [Didymodactylos carnosus]